MTPLPPATCDGCRWLRVWRSDDSPLREARCGWRSLALISHNHRLGDPRPQWCDKEKEPAS